MDPDRSLALATQVMTMHHHIMCTRGLDNLDAYKVIVDSYPSTMYQK